jgi:outer membrane receptor protein involved in Fe transport
MRYFLLAGCAAIAMPTGALAQTIETAPSAEVLSDQGETIIVTGQKFEVPLLEVTSSVRVTTAEEIAREPITDLYDIVNRIPNVNDSLGGQGFSIRGVDQRGIGGSGATLTVYVDDSPLDNQTTFFGPLDSWDLGQVEVYRGPQSTNFGRNALAGAIYVRTQDPTYEWDVRARGEIGNNGIRQAAVALGGPIVDESFAFRISANIRDSDGFIFNSFLDERADATELRTARLKLLMEPAEGFKIITTSSYTENFAGEDVLDPTNGNPGNPLSADDVERVVAYDTPGSEGTNTFIQSVNITVGLADNLEIQSISTYQDTDYTRIEDFDISPLPIAALDRSGNDESFTQEVRLRYTGGRLKAAIGGYYLHNTGDFTDSFVTGATILNPALPSSILFGRDSTNTTTTENYALFVDGEFALADRIDVLFGARYDNETVENTAQAVTFIANPPLPPGFEFLEAFTGTESAATSASFDAFLPKGGLRYRFSDDANIAFVAQRAYRAGGAEINVLTGDIETFDPEFLWNYELSLRTNLLDGQLQWNSNVFYSDWSNQQVPEPLPGFPNIVRTVNAGASTLYGFETEFTFDVADEWEIFGGLGYSFTEFDNFANPSFDPGLPESEFNQENFAGNRFPFAPRWSANGGISYDGSKTTGIFGGIDVNYQSAMFQENENFDANFFGERVLANVRLGYAITPAIRLSGYVKNLFDEQYFTALGVEQAGSEFARLGAERTFAARIDVDF